ncbi:hypothetical protein PRVXH_000470 [Proteinivorax hydrogeniformans]|uniref:Intracellular proteinase inhibitor BsuPI domain-containing protein n=1 Tax=Proteinivorax hydrogeniformans TaxID=1826727 RepID=A0AAU8HUV1_9FIRM
MKTTPILGVISIAIIIVILATNLGNSKLEPTKPEFLQVKTSLDRYGSEEVIHVCIKNKSDDEILFGDNFLGLNMFVRKSSGLWERYYPDIDIKLVSLSLKPGEVANLEIRCSGMDPGEYKLTFEGWEKENFNELITAQVNLIITPYPKIKVKSDKTEVRPRESLSLTVINDRLHDITFSDSTLGMKVYIKDDDEWMQIPSPLYSDGIELTLSPGQIYELDIPPLRASGRYRFMFYGVDSEDAVITGEKEITVIRR